jgi:hypothetical protein
LLDSSRRLCLELRESVSCTLSQIVVVHLRPDRAASDQHVLLERFSVKRIERPGTTEMETGVRIDEQCAENYEEKINRGKSKTFRENIRTPPHGLDEKITHPFGSHFCCNVSTGKEHGTAAEEERRQGYSIGQITLDPIAQRRGRIHANGKN